MTTGRGEARGFNGAVASPHTLTSATAMEVLAAGGNAVDAAVAANATQGTVAPETCGIGGDLFALVWEPGTTSPLALNASGPAGSGVDAAAMRDQGHTSIPADHPSSISVPGAVAGWEVLLRRLGTIKMADALRPAISHARDGFPASFEFARATRARFEQLASQPSGAELYAGGAPASVGDRIQRPLLAETLEAIAANGRRGFYAGSVARDVSAASSGQVTLDDLESYEPEWVSPARKRVLGTTGWTIGPNTQGYVTLATLRIFEMLGIEFDPDDPAAQHNLIEAYRSVASERDDVVTDTRFAPMSSDELLDEDRLAAIASSIGEVAGRYSPPGRQPAGTAYLCVVDPAGMAVSLIQSNFHGIGSGIGAGESGFILHNRGAGACLTPGHPNELSPGKRPLHTLAPTIWGDEAHASLILGTRGGHQQPQLLAQVAANVYDAGDPLWTAQARSRWTMRDLTGAESEVFVESGFPSRVTDGLERRGHRVVRVDDYTGGWGPVSIIGVRTDGLRTAAADPRVETASALAT